MKSIIWDSKLIIFDKTEAIIFAFKMVHDDVCYPIKHDKTNKH